jgi:hypothetical protein
MLAGPMLRKVTSTTVTGTDLDNRLMEGSRRTTAFGTNLHIVAASAMLRSARDGDGCAITRHDRRADRARISVV